MKRVWLILVAVFVFATCTFGLSASASQSTAVQVNQEIRMFERVSWTLACYINQVDCSNIPRPLVIYADLPPEQKIWGVYELGNSYVVLSNELNGDTFSTVILAHEYTHYLQFIQRKFHAPGDPKEIECATEQAATTVGYIVAIAAGVDNDPRVPTWDDVKDSYGCEK